MKISEFLAVRKCTGCVRIFVCIQSEILYVHTFICILAKFEFPARAKKITFVFNTIYGCVCLPFHGCQGLNSLSIVGFCSTKVSQAEAKTECWHWSGSEPGTCGTAD